ncbi:hypothetical protein PBY51_016438 [Eleginops maclovinus]|nr:hypothetical protein PBY51_016438 [Eleginops maclovinus]
MGRMNVFSDESDACQQQSNPAPQSNHFLPVCCWLTAACQSRDVLEVQACGRHSRCCLVLVMLMGERRRGKGTETPGERMNEKRLEDEKHHVMETERGR